MTNELKYMCGVPLKNYTTFGIGGNAKKFALASDVSDIIAAQRLCERHFILGRGSNVLFSDDGFDGVVIKNDIRITSLTEKEAYFGAGIPLALLSKTYFDFSIEGMEWACSIPGTVGGAVVMNAGAHGGDIEHMLLYVDILIGEKTFRFTRDECGFSYRRSTLPVGAVVIGAGFKVKYGDKNKIAALTEENILKRKRSQPTGVLSAGSVFKAVEGVPAYQYIEQVGLKGYKVGGAAISEKHANFIINEGGATALDVLTLINVIRGTVYAKFDVKLETEIKKAGF